MGSLLASLMGIFNKLFIENETVKMVLKENKTILGMLVLIGVLCIAFINVFKQNIQKDQIIYNSMNAEKTVNSKLELLQKHTEQLLEISNEKLKLKETEIQLLKSGCKKT